MIIKRHSKAAATGDMAASPAGRRSFVYLSSVDAVKSSRPSHGRLVVRELVLALTRTFGRLDNKICRPLNVGCSLF